MSRAAMPEATPLSVVIVNHNGRRFLDGCLDSLRQFLDPGSEVILVDNRSTDDSLAHVRSRHPWVRIVQSETNRGFAAGNNLGVAAARGELLLLVNVDTRITGSLRPLVELLRDDRVGAAGCRLVYGNGNLQPSLGREHTALRMAAPWYFTRSSHLPRLLRRVETASRFYERAQRGVGWASGACLLTRASLWRELGGMDEGYFMYVEDVDYCRRVRDAGYRIDYTPEPRVVHYEAGGGAWVGPRALLWTVDSYLSYSRRFQGRGSTLLLRVLLAGAFGVRALAYGLRGLRADRHLDRERRDAYRAALRRALARAQRLPPPVTDATARDEGP